ncbi:MAG: ABC transporter permease, partial [Bacteroidetes bacterium HGW-Bacteroidetes-13]
SLPYPVRFEPQNFGIVFLTIVVLGMIAAKIASHRISDRLLVL